MAITALPTDAQVNWIWSSYGVVLRLDDNQDGSEDTGLRATAYQKATLDVYQALMQRGYSVTAIAASTWATWAAAYIAAVAIGKRRGNGCPQGLLDDEQKYLDALEDIRMGRAELISDTGFATVDAESLPCVSNMVVDSRFGAESVRRVAATSTGKDAGTGVRQRDALNVWPGGWW